MASLSDVVKDIKNGKQGQEDEPTDKKIRDDWRQTPAPYFLKVVWTCLITAAICFALFLVLFFGGRI